MDLKPGAASADPKPDTTAPLAPDHFARAEDALTRLMEEVARANAERRAATAEPPSEPQKIEPPLETASAEPQIAAPTIEVAPRPSDTAHADSAPDDRPPRRTMFRFLRAACIGVIATLAWQSYGGAARQMIATYVPALGAPAPTVAPSAATGARDSEPVQANGAAVQDPATVPVGAASVASAPSSELAEQVKSMGRELAAVRQSVEQLAALRQDVEQLSALRQSVDQLTAAQEQMSRALAKRQAADDELRAKLANVPAAKPAPKPTARTAQPAPQQLAPGPRPLSQSFGPSPPPPTPAPGPAPAPARPSTQPRPPASIP
jgi:hypothetical protein